jgi:hypothetical protein
VEAIHQTIDPCLHMFYTLRRFDPPCQQRQLSPLVIPMQTLGLVTSNGMRSRMMIELVYLSSFSISLLVFVAKREKLRG